MRRVLSSLAVGILVAASAFGQSVISAHSGVIHWIEGRVLVGDQPIVVKPGEFKELKQNEVLNTEEGKAEVLLTPGAFLRVGENSSVRMVSNHLSDTRFELVKGEAIVECDELLKDNAITVLYKETAVALEKKGLYRFDLPPARARVYEGEAIVTGPSGHLTLTKGHETTLDGALMAVKFDTKTGDELMRWAARRSEALAMANVSAARSMNSSGGSYIPTNGMWGFNPYFGMFTYIPASGIAYSPWGFPFWSPYASYYYMPYYDYGFYPGYGSYGGYGGGGASKTGSASTFAGAPRWSAVGRSGSGGAFNPGHAVGTPGAVGRSGGFGGGTSGFSSGRSVGGYSGGSSGGGGGFSGGGSSSGGGGFSGGGGHGGGGGGGAVGGGGGHR
ncbi:MAG TPA: hypothetical protein VKU01_34050 [Bryobacteraceae bacterium]|nr:hypothetical protein [Bryobacteraceae bacterium]